jgi:hypothetical protein
MNAAAHGKGTYINHISHDFNELILEDDDMAIAREQDLITAFPCDLELERRIVAPLKRQIAA